MNPFDTAALAQLRPPDRANESRTSRVLALPPVRIVLGLLAVAAPVALILWLAHAGLDKSLRVVWPQLLAAAACLASYHIYVRHMERRKASELSGPGAGLELAQGTFGAAALLAGTMGVLLLLGTYQVSGTDRLSVVIVPMAELVLVAVIEELAFRGVVFRVLEQSLGSWIALGLTSLLFALSHLPNEGVTGLALAVTAMAGVMLCAAFMATGRLWLGIGMHFGWNFMLGPVFSVAVSGHAVKGLVHGTLAGPEWLTGGAYGLEASIAGLAATSVASFFLLSLTRRRGRIVPPRWKRPMPA